MIMCQIPQDRKRWPIEDRLGRAVNAARAAYQLTLTADTPLARQQAAARLLQQAIDRLLDYVMRDILPPDLRD